MRLLHPLLLLTAIPIAAVAVVLIWRARRTGVERRPVVATLRYATLVLLVLALAQPQIGHGSGGPTVLAIDRSQSITASATKSERAWLHTANRDDCAANCRVVQFGGTGVLTPPSDGLLPTRTGGPLEGDQTNLQSALGLALARTPKGGRVALLSDGFQTTGDTSTSAAEARARHIRIDVVPLTDSQTDAGVTRVQAPQALHAGDPLSLEVTIRSTVASAATLYLRRDGVVVGHQKVGLAVGDNPFLFSLRAPKAGSYSYQVNVSMPGDRVAQDNALATTVRIAAQPNVLVAGEGSNSTIVGMLQADGMRVQVIAPGKLPTTAGAYSGEDAVVLDDVSASQLGKTRSLALTEAVRSGTVGLFALGGQHSFSLGRYYKSPLQQALPVSSLVPGNLQKRNIGLELILDRSGSMSEDAGGVPKIKMAQAASRDAIKFLASHSDDLGIVDFDIEPHTLVPVIRVTKGKVAAEVDKRIDGLQADGGTNIYKALAAGARQIEASTEPDRHIILMTDGVSEPGSYAALVPELKKDHITVSTVALGDEADFSLLKAIAKSTGGRYYAASNAHELPRIFAKETRLSARPVRLHGKIAVSAGDSSPVVRSLSAKALPVLHGNVVTTLKQGAQADLLGQDKGHSPDPVLAQWQYGVGRVVTWTPGLSTEWAATWTKRPQLFQDAVRWIERGVGIPALTPSVVPGSTTELEVDTVDNADTSLDLAQLTGSLVKSGGTPIPVRFTQTEPSHYVATVPTLTQGVYQYTVSDGASTTRGLLAVPYPSEYRLGLADDTPLGPLAAATGGRVLNVHDPAAIESRWTALWWWLALAALVCFLAGTALRMLYTGGGSSPRGPLTVRRLRVRRARRPEQLRREDREAVRL